MSDEKKEGIPQDTEGKAVAGPEGGASGSRGGGKSRFFPVLSVILGLLLAGVVAFYNIPAFHVLLHPHAGGDNAAMIADKYTCGMHPFIISDKPGNCPICGMTLTKIEGSAAPGAATATSSAPAATPSGGARKILFYRNPMNPQITSKTPAKDEMGMDYAPVYEDEVKGSGAGVDLPEGYATVQVGMERVQMAGIQSAPAVREAISHPVRAVGIVVPDERRVRRVQSKVEGWVEKLHTNFVGQMVTKGQPLLEIYSPDLVATQ
ncbi:MAG TPA: efflux RND transporter periplasmic adaptor subunit, partial [Candidatus Bathyarchaeia archaeon]|nr:efflux RND transporter periplasmic adaptor subunit [Candidatus Bathyarchaeia archaeon]